ncbi:hypothetical protein GHT06_014709 [Daphnia sinensis]|uniref:Uncharacterized protein n=1 Tax=Daphnia sinensis TaxID=1820382 RepID=A0AAD5PSM4_9CRUS|nr:hypothetical protein GHT06_014709 [Daphnia sinensis]
MGVIPDIIVMVKFKDGLVTKQSKRKFGFPTIPFIQKETRRDLTDVGAFKRQIFVLLITENKYKIISRHWFEHAIY